MDETPPNQNPPRSPAMYTKAAAQRILKGIATKIEAVRVLPSVVQVTYKTKHGRCSTFISKKSFEADFIELRQQGAIGLTVEAGVHAFVVRNASKGTAYTVTIDGQCGCKDYQEHQLPCKHVRAVLNFLGSSTIAA